MKIVHIITGLGNGGAERQFDYYIRYRKIDAEIIVISLTNDNLRYYDSIHNRVDKLYILNFKGWNTLRDFVKLCGILKVIKPDIVQTWMYHADFFGGLASRLTTKAKVYWNIRNGSIDLKGLSIKTSVLIWVNSLLSYFIPNRIIYCAFNAKINHERFLFNKLISTVVHNGISISSPYSDLKKVNDGLQGVVKICNISRWHPHKDHRTLIKAFAIVDSKFSNLEFHLVGRSLNSDNLNLIKLLSTKKWNNRWILHGEITDVNSFLSQMDLFVLSSLSEGFPNVILEAQLNNVFCISTKVGDVDYLIDHNWQCGIGSSGEMAELICNYLKLEQSGLQEILEKSRYNIVQNFSLTKMVNEYDKIYIEGQKAQC